MNSTDVQMKLLDLLKNGGGSGRGGSFWRMAAQCGACALRAEQGMLPEITASWARVGTAYHMLHQWHAEGQELALDYLQNFDKDVTHALLLFRAHLEYWGGAKYWGNIVSMEQVYPQTEQGEAKVRAEFEGELYQIKPDLIVDMTATDVARVRDRVMLPGEGRYIIDWKTSSDASDITKYHTGPQATMYPYVYNLDQDVPVRGIIFDVVEKHRWNAKDTSRKREHFSATFCSADFLWPLPFQRMVRQGARNIHHNECSHLLDTCQ